MELVDKIKIDIVRKGNTPVVYAVQGESLSRVVSVDILNNGFPVNIRGQKASVVYKKPDGTSGWYDRVQDGTSAIKPQIGSIDYNISAKITPQMLTVPGIVYAAIRIEEQDGSERATTFPFIVDVTEDPGYDAQKSENYYNVQNWGDVNQKIKEIEETISSFSYVIDDLVIDKKTTWSSKNIVDMLCPDIKESGSVVTCEPVAGYPLTVKTDDMASTITRCGKNLAYCTTAYSGDAGGLAYSRRIGDSFVTLNGTATTESSITMVADLPLKAGTYTLSIYGANTIDYTHDRGAATLAKGPDLPYILVNRPATFTIDTDTTIRVNFVFQTGSVYNNARVYFQIEAGNAGTDFEQHTSETFAPGETIPALPGVNTLFADIGEITVTGKANPVSIINNLQKKVFASEAAVAEE